MGRRKGDDELAVVENGLKDAALLNDDILNFGKIDGITVPVEKEGLIELNNPEIRNNENLEVVIEDPD
jgi:hypothetical protein